MLFDLCCRYDKFRGFFVFCLWVIIQGVFIKRVNLLDEQRKIRMDNESTKLYTAVVYRNRQKEWDGNNNCETPTKSPVASQIQFFQHKGKLLTIVNGFRIADQIQDTILFFPSLSFCLSLWRVHSSWTLFCWRPFPWRRHSSISRAFYLKYVDTNRAATPASNTRPGFSVHIISIFFISPLKKRQPGHSGQYVSYAR